MEIIYDLTVLNQRITDLCLTHYEAHKGEATDPLALADAIMATDGFPMHYPCHHYLVPAVLLTVVRAAQNKEGTNLQADLALAQERALTVPGGACGFQGCCGAAVGIGIFWSVIMPNVKPAWLTIIIFSVQNLWNTNAATVIYTESKKTLVYALQQIQAGGIARTGVAAAVTVIVMVVPISIFILSQSQILETMASSGLKE